jgi:DnaJ-class molecular chaperone
LFYYDDREAHAVARVEWNMRTAVPRETKCEACNGTGFPKVKQPTEPGRKIFPAPCRKCGGKGRIKVTG